MITSRLLLILFAVLGAFATVGGWHVYQFHLEKPEEYATATVAYVAAVAALVGWIVQSFIAMRNSRKQHTINVLFQTRMNPEFANNVANIHKPYPSPQNIPADAIKKMEDQSVFDSVKYVLNYYEFIAVGIRHGDLDEKLMRDCLCSQLCKFCGRANDVIRDARGESPEGVPSPDKKRILKHLRWLYWRWEPHATNRRFPWLLYWIRRWQSLGRG